MVTETRLHHNILDRQKTHEPVFVSASDIDQQINLINAPPSVPYLMWTFQHGSKNSFASFGPHGLRRFWSSRRSGTLQSVSVCRLAAVCFCAFLNVLCVCLHTHTHTVPTRALTTDHKYFPFLQIKGLMRGVCVCVCVCVCVREEGERI